ncbi:MAG: substrate-binding domain-containing protein [Bacteroidales bacterium]
MRKKVSLKDIAERVGVSTALVSYVINGQEKEKRVGKELANRIREVAAELNYQPNQIARSLRMKSTRTIGLIVADIANPFFGQLARIVENEAAEIGYTVIIGSTDENLKKSEDLINSLLTRQVDGFLIVPSDGARDQIAGLVAKKIPLVLIDRYFPEVSTSYVILDNFQATYEATRQLIERKYENITLMAYKTSLIHMRERIRGYMQAMTDANLKANCNVEEIRHEQFEKDIENAFSKIMRNDQRQGLVFATNALSIGGLYYMRQHCLHVPEDFGFIGFDGGECFDLHNPPLSFVQQPLVEMGKESFRLLVDLIGGASKTSRIVLSPSLVIRNEQAC